MEYKFIVNPKTGRKCDIHSKKGQQIINDYIQIAGVIHCSCCGKAGTNKSTCPFNPDVIVPRPAKHNSQGFPDGCKQTQGSRASSRASSRAPSRASSPKPFARPLPKPVAKPLPKPVSRPLPKSVAKPLPKPVASISPKRVFDGYLEGQQRAWCLKHALNHILQEKKIEVLPGNHNTEVEINGDILFNLYGLCLQKYISIFGEESLKRGDRYISQQQMFKKLNDNGFCGSSGYYQIDLGISILKELGYYVNEEDIDLWVRDLQTVAGEKRIMSEINWRKYADDLNKPDFLGSLVLINGPHYVAVSKHINTCKTREQGFAYLDSIGLFWECGDIEKMVKILKTKKPKRIINVFYRRGRGVYECKACKDI